jgi:tRNA acetyltransferase TAN1
MKRDAIIKTIAGLVGQPHKVDLKNYDLLIMVEIYQVGILHAIGESVTSICWLSTQNICGVSVVDHRFEELKRYNISEIFDPTPKEEAVKERAEVVTKVETVPTVAEDKDGAAATEEVADKVVEGDGVVSITDDDATKDEDDQGDVSVVKDELQADAPAGAPLASDD